MGAAGRGPGQPCGQVGQQDTLCACEVMTGISGHNKAAGWQLYEHLCQLQEEFCIISMS